MLPPSLPPPPLADIVTYYSVLFQIDFNFLKYKLVRTAKEQRQRQTIHQFWILLTLSQPMAQPPRRVCGGATRHRPLPLRPLRTCPLPPPLRSLSASGTNPLLSLHPLSLSRLFLMFLFHQLFSYF